MLAAMATGTSKISGLLEGADVLATMRAMQALGAHIEKHDNGDWHVTGVGPMGLSAPNAKRLISAMPVPVCAGYGAGCRCRHWRAIYR